MSDDGEAEALAAADRAEVSRDGGRSLQDSADGLATQVEKLRSELVIQKSFNRRMSRVARALSIGLVVVLLVAAGVGFLYANQRTFSHCLQSWADESTHRSDKLSGASQDRNDAVDAILRTLTLPQDQVQSAFAKALEDYIAASDRYRDVSARFPVPTSPKLTC